MPPTERNVPTSSGLHLWLGVSQNAGLATPGTICRRPAIGQYGNMEEREWIGANAETPESQKYVGMSRDDALKAADMAGVKAVRVIEGTQHLTADFRSDRL